MDLLKLLEEVSRAVGLPALALVAVYAVAVYRTERQQDRKVMHELADAVSKLRDLFGNHETRISRLEGALE